MTNLDVRREGTSGIIRVTLRRPTRKNALDLALIRELAAFAAAVERDLAARVVVLSGAGDAFCVGGDIAEFVAQKARLHAHLVEMTGAMHAAVRSLCRMPAALLVAVNGVAAGGGFALALVADLTIAARSARFVSAYTRSGLTPDTGASWFLPRLVGRQRAFDLFTTNRTLTAEEAATAGLVARVVDDEVFEAEVTRVAETIAGLPSGAAAGVKRLLDAETTRALDAHLDQEARLIADMGAAPETVARLEAFVARVAPSR